MSIDHEQEVSIPGVGVLGFGGRWANDDHGGVHRYRLMCDHNYDSENEDEWCFAEFGPVATLEELADAASAGWTKAMTITGERDYCPEHPEG